MTNFIAYYRVSTVRQGESGLGLEAQKAMIANHITPNDTIIAEYTEVESGKRNNRSQLQAALNQCRTEKATLIIGKLDRLARNAAFLLSLRDAGIEFIACDIPTANRLVVGIMALVAEEEGRVISERTKAALAHSKKALGFSNPIRRDGKRARRASIVARTEAATAHAQYVKGIIDEIKGAGIDSLSGIAKALTARGIKTARGGGWYPATVKNVLDRAV
jgi:DNA invertase Pin-like site-specific DNA recombinase